MRFKVKGVILPETEGDVVIRASTKEDRHEQVVVAYSLLVKESCACAHIEKFLGESLETEDFSVRVWVKDSGELAE